MQGKIAVQSERKPESIGRISKQNKNFFLMSVTRCTSSVESVAHKTYSPGHLLHENVEFSDWKHVFQETGNFSFVFHQIILISPANHWWSTKHLTTFFTQDEHKSPKKSLVKTVPSRSFQLLFIFFDVLQSQRVNWNLSNVLIWLSDPRTTSQTIWCWLAFWLFSACFNFGTICVGHQGDKMLSFSIYFSGETLRGFLPVMFCPFVWVDNKQGSHSVWKFWIFEKTFSNQENWYFVKVLEKSDEKKPGKSGGNWTIWKKREDNCLQTILFSEFSIILFSKLEWLVCFFRLLQTRPLATQYWARTKMKEMRWSEKRTKFLERWGRGISGERWEPMLIISHFQFAWIGGTIGPRQVRIVECPIHTELASRVFFYTVSLTDSRMCIHNLCHLSLSWAMVLF